MSTKKRRRIAGFDGLRSIALIGVLLFHMFPRTIKGGYFGVIIFFLLSGFLSAYGSASGKKTGVLKYYFRRFLRIYPALILMIFISIEAVALADHFKLQNTQEEVVSILLGYNNFWQISKRADYFANLEASSPFTHLWYLSIVIQFELLWPFLDRLAKRNMAGLKVLGAITVLSLFALPVGVLFHVPITELYYGTVYRIHALLLGAFIGRYSGMKRKPQLPHIKAAAVSGYLIAYLVITLFLFKSAEGSGMWVYWFGMGLYSLMTGIAVFLLANTKAKTGVVLDAPGTGFLSKYSYEIFLWQYPVLFVFTLLHRSSNLFHYLLQLIVILILSVWSHTLIGRIPG